MSGLVLALLMVAADPDEGSAKKLRPIYVKEAEEYAITIASEPKTALELKKEPVFEWSNPVRDGVQQGAVFVWLRDGRPAALGCVFSHTDDTFPGRRVMHEFHALDTEKLTVTRPKEALNEWKPEAGLERNELPDAPAPADTPATRLIQMKKLVQAFTGDSTDGNGKHWDLRLLPAPLYRYPSAKAGTIDGALFVFVSTAGTDPEVLLLIEARQEKDKTRWEFACGRFSDRNLYVKYKEKEAWSMVRGDTNTGLHDARHLYRFYPDKVVNSDGEPLARVRATDKKWDFIPVNKK
jgi:hypothetical protein